MQRVCKRPPVHAGQLQTPESILDYRVRRSGGRKNGKSEVLPLKFGGVYFGKSFPGLTVGGQVFVGMIPNRRDTPSRSKSVLSFWSE